MVKVMVKGFLPFYLFTFLLFSCGSRKSATIAESADVPVGPAFVADSAYQFCEQQCAFGPRTMNSRAHDLCAQWIRNSIRTYIWRLYPLFRNQQNNVSY